MEYIILALLILIALLLIVNLMMSMQSFQKELRYLDQEIGRTAGEEQKYWKKRKRQLYLSLIPFVFYK